MDVRIVLPVFAGGLDDLQMLALKEPAQFLYLLRRQRPVRNDKEHFRIGHPRFFRLLKILCVKKHRDQGLARAGLPDDKQVASGVKLRIGKCILLQRCKGSKAVVRSQLLHAFVIHYMSFFFG